MRSARVRTAAFQPRGRLVAPLGGSWHNFAVKVERDEDGWFVGTVLALPGCYTQARTERELYKRIWEAIELAQKDSVDTIAKSLDRRRG